MSCLSGAGWRRLGASLTATGLAAAAGALASLVLAIWGVRSGRVEWSFATEVLLGLATPALAAVALLTGAAAAASALAATPRGRWLPAALAALLGAGLLTTLGAWRAQQMREALLHPPVHDVATDWRDPLMPSAALLRRRGADALPIEAAPTLSEGPRGGFLGRPVAEVSAAGCPQARPLLLRGSAAAAYARLRAAALRSGLRLVTDAPADGVLEAEASAPIAYGGRADVLARVRPRAGGATVDLRSTSRHGAVDGGTNCLRVAALLAATAG